MNRSKRRRQRHKPQMAANIEMPGQAETSSPKQQTPTLQQALGLAVQYHSAGQLPEAECIYRQVLQIDPNQPVALHYLGVISHQVGKNDIAVDLIKKALAIQSDYAEANYNLGNAFKELGKTDEALASYRKALDTNPDYAEAYNNLGVALQDLGQLDEAVASYDKALATRPSYDEAHNNLGNALQDLGQLDEAVASYHKALAIKPDYAEAYSNLANALQGLRKLDEAIANYHKALTINPDFAEAHSNLGVALQDLGQLDEAVASCHRALAVKPDYVEGYSNLSVVLQELGKLEEAVASCQKALAIKPDSAEVHVNLGTIFQDLGMLKEAVASYQKALAIKPNDTEAGRNLLFAMLNVPGLSPGELFTEHLRFAENHAPDISKPSEELANKPTPDRRLRVGYLSSDFWDHPVGRNILPMLSTHDRSEFEVFCYADVRRHDAITERFRSSVDHWLTIFGKSDAEVARMVRADGIDVLVCLAGRYDGNRPLVCAHRAAPVQVSYHDGATSGLEEMDYLLTDKFLNPPDTKELFTEELYRLPVYHLYPPVEEAPLVKALPAEQTGTITFGSFNNPAKINEEVIHLWAEVMKSVSNSRLLLKYKNWYDQASLRVSVVERFSAYGIGQDRITFNFKSDAMKEHLDRYSEVDIALDPFPFNGATTTFQALWMGVPVVSLAGETFMSRATGSILHPGDLGDLVVDTPESYVTCARDLAEDVARLRTLRATLRERIAASPLCNPPDHARSVEVAYRVMWQKWCSGHGNTP